MNPNLVTAAGLVSDSFESARGSMRASVGLARLSIFGVSVLWSLVAAQALDVNVPNGSFESPKPPLGFPASPLIDVWQKSPQPPGIPLPSGITWDQLSGVFPNTAIGSVDHIDNVNGAQAAYLFAIPGVALSQTLDSKYEVGTAYRLSLGVLGGGGIAEGSSFAISLFYNDAAKNPVTVGTLGITYSAAKFPNATHLRDYSLDIPKIQPADAAAGKNIGVQLSSTFGTGAGYWDIDNVRVVAIPEPSALALLFLGAGGWALRQARARRLH